MWCGPLCWFSPVLIKAYAAPVSFDEIPSAGWAPRLQKCKRTLSCTAPFLNPLCKFRNTKHKSSGTFHFQFFILSNKETKHQNFHFRRDHSKANCAYLCMQVKTLKCCRSSHWNLGPDLIWGTSTCALRCQVRRKIFEWIIKLLFSFKAESKNRCMSSKSERNLLRAVPPLSICLEQHLWGQALLIARTNCVEGRHGSPADP